MRHFLKITDRIDVRPLLAELEANPDLWGANGWRKQLGPHTRMSDIWIRYNAPENIGPRFNDEHEPIWYPAYDQLPSLKGILFPLMAEVEGERLGGVLITRITPGAGIDHHVDRGWHVETFDKFYVSLKSAPGARFICHEGVREVLEPRAGECWRFDNRKPHSVENTSDQDRVTLIVCIQTQKFRQEERSHARAA